MNAEDRVKRPCATPPGATVRRATASPPNSVPPRHDDQPTRRGLRHPRGRNVRHGERHDDPVVRRPVRVPGRAVPGHAVRVQAPGREALLGGRGEARIHLDGHHPLAAEPPGRQAGVPAGARPDVQHAHPVGHVQVREHPARPCCAVRLSRPDRRPPPCPRGRGSRGLLPVSRCDGRAGVQCGVGIGVFGSGVAWQGLLGVPQVGWGPGSGWTMVQLQPGAGSLLVGRGPGVFAACVGAGRLRVVVGDGVSVFAAVGAGMSDGDGESEGAGVGEGVGDAEGVGESAGAEVGDRVTAGVAVGCPARPETATAVTAATTVAATAAPARRRENRGGRAETAGSAAPPAATAGSRRSSVGAVSPASFTCVLPGRGRHRRRECRGLPRRGGWPEPGTAATTSQ